MHMDMNAHAKCAWINEVGSVEDQTRRLDVCMETGLRAALHEDLHAYISSRIGY